MDAWLKYLRRKNLMVRINIQYQFGIDVVCSSSIIELLERRKFHNIRLVFSSVLIVLLVGVKCRCMYGIVIVMPFVVHRVQIDHSYTTA